MKKNIWFLLIILLFDHLQARYYVVKNESQFAEEINKHQFAIVCFLRHIDQDMDKSDQKNLKKNSNLLQDTIKATSETDPYKKVLKQEVAFIIVDTHKESLEPLLHTYKIASDQTPQILLFKNGKVVTQMSGDFAQLPGFVCKSDVLEFMNDYFGKDFDEILEQKSQEEAKDREMELARYQAFAASRYPYGGYAPYNVWGSPSGSIYTGYASFYPYGYSYNGFAYLIP